MNSFELIDGVPDELGALLLAPRNPVALLEQVVVNLVAKDAVLLVLWVSGDKLPHPLGHGHQLACFKATAQGGYTHRPRTSGRFVEATNERHFTRGTFLDEFQVVQDGAAGVHVYLHVFQIAVQDWD